MNSTLKVRVHRKCREALDIAGFELVGIDGAELPAFLPGSHIDVHIPDGPTRQYSLCNDAGERHRYRIAVLRDPQSRGGSAALHDRVNEGDTLTVSAPRNHFPLLPSTRTILLAGGIGITPLLCMARQLAKDDVAFSLHYCTRSAERTAFLGEIATSDFAGQVWFHHDDGHVAQKLSMELALGTADAATHIYACGPVAFIDFVTKDAAARGFSGMQIHREYFGASPLASDPRGSFEVQIASTRQVVEVDAGQTVVQALAGIGVDIPVSCEQGVCGTCITGVLSGECDHRDMYFSDEEKAAHDQFTPCCSRARSSRLVLDL